MAGILVRLPLPHLFSKAESPVIRRLDSVQIWRWVLVGFWAAMGCPGRVGLAQAVMTAGLRRLQPSGRPVVGADLKNL